jgi:hypothetical protein
MVRGSAKALSELLAMNVTETNIFAGIRPSDRSDAATRGAERVGRVGVSASDDARLSDQRLFSDILSQHTGAPRTREEQARKAAEDFVAQALVQPLLARLRESSQAAPPFGPGPGQKAFQGMIDASFSQKLVRNQRWDLVGKIERALLERGGVDASGGAPQQPALSPAPSRLRATPDSLLGDRP